MFLKGKNSKMYNIDSIKLYQTILTTHFYGAGIIKSSFPRTNSFSSPEKYTSSPLAEDVFHYSVKMIMFVLSCCSSNWQLYCVPQYRI